MTRKLIALGVLVAALVGGAGAVAACLVSADHLTPVPAAERSSGEPNNSATETDGTAADLTNWQEVRVVIVGSKFR